MIRNVNIFPSRQTGLALVIFIALIAFQCRSPKGPVINVYSSSQDGDRLTKNHDNQFAKDKGNALPVIVVSDSVRYQQIEGFGATFNEAGMICLNSLRGDVRDRVFKSLFDPDSGAGFTVMKSPITACDFASAGPWYSFDQTPGDTLMKHFGIERDLGPNGLVTFIKKASEYGKFEIESPMDFAPDWMYYAIKPGKKHIQPKYYYALARYYSKYLQAYAAHGVTIGYLNLFNEADNPWYSNVTYKVIGELIKNYVAPRLKADGLSTKIQFGETANRPEAIRKFPAVLNDPGIIKQLNSLTIHGYDWDQFSTVDSLHNLYPGLPIWQTEVCYARSTAEPINEPPNGPAKLPVYDFSDGEFWGNMIMNDMKHWVSAWIYWNMILDENGGPWLISVEHGDGDDNHQQPVVIINRKIGEVTYTGLYYYLAHFSKFIRPGAVRIGSSGGTLQLNFAAFRNADSSLVLNIINNGAATDCRIKWNNEAAVQKLKAHSITTLKWNKAL